MQVRIVPYSELFVSVTFTLDETAALADCLEVASEAMPPEVQKVTEALRKELLGALQRAGDIQAKRDI